MLRSTVSLSRAIAVGFYRPGVGLSNFHLHDRRDTLRVAIADLTSAGRYNRCDLPIHSYTIPANVDSNIIDNHLFFDLRRANPQGTTSNDNVSIFASGARGGLY